MVVVWGVNLLAAWALSAERVEALSWLWGHVFLVWSLILRLGRLWLRFESFSASVWWAMAGVMCVAVVSIVGRVAIDCSGAFLLRL